MLYRFFFRIFKMSIILVKNSKKGMYCVDLCVFVCMLFNDITDLAGTQDYCASVLLYSFIE